jgi:hypothetical protein
LDPWDGDKRRIGTNGLTKKVVNSIANVSDFLQWKKKSKAEKDKDIANMKLEIRRCFLKGKEEKNHEIDRTKSDIKEIIEKEFGSSDKTESDLFIKLDQETWNNVENEVYKVMIKFIGKQVLKTGGKNCREICSEKATFWNWTCCWWVFWRYKNIQRRF